MSDILIRGMEMPETGVYILSVDKTDADAAIFTVSEQTNSGKIIPKHVGKAVTIQPHGTLKDVDALPECDLMPYREAANRIEDHMRIHYFEEYPRAQKITEALQIAIDLLRDMATLQEGGELIIHLLKENTIDKVDKETITTANTAGSAST